MRVVHFAIMVFVVTILASCSSAPPTGPDAGKALIEESATAMGGWDNINAIKTQEILTGGADWEPMQSVEPKGEPRMVDNFGQSIVVDLQANKMRLAHDGKRTYPVPGPVKFIEIIDGNTGMLQTLSA